MRLSEQLKKLEAERDREWRDAALDFARLKHETSPDRFIRRHMGTALIAAGVLGMIVAPGRGRPPRERRGRHGRLGGMVRGMEWLFDRPRETHAAPSAGPGKPGSEAVPPDGTHSQRGGEGGLLESLLEQLPALAGQLNWEAIFRALVEGLRHGKAAPSAPATEENGQQKSPEGEPESP